MLKNHKHRVRCGSAGLIVASALLLGACASPGVRPVAEIATARASLTQAESAGAVQLAPVELLAARAKFTKAETAVREERYVEARRLAEEAEVGAELAERKSRAVKAMRAADELNRANATLEAELARKARP